MIDYNAVLQASQGIATRNQLISQIAEIPGSLALISRGWNHLVLLQRSAFVTDAHCSLVDDLLASESMNAARILPRKHKITE